MKKFVWGIGILLCLWASSSAQPRSQNYKTLREQVIPAKDLQEDFNYLRKALEETHPGLYRYNSREVMKHKMDSLYDLLSAEMKFQDYYLLLASLFSDIRCAHTTIQPAGDWMGLILRDKIFPFLAIVIQDRVYVTINASKDITIKPGFEFVAINGQPMDSIRRFIFHHLSADGYNESLKQRMIGDNKFIIFYNMLISQADSFHIVCRNLTGETAKVTVPAIPSSQINKLAAQNPVNKDISDIYGPRTKLNQKKPWRLEIHKEKDAAVLTIREFGGGKNAEEARKKMRDFMDESVDRLKKVSINNLIIDLRYNSGGWDHLGQELFTYLIDTPALFYQRFHTVTDNSEFLKFSSVSKEELANLKNELIPEKDGTFTVKEEYNSTLAIQHPKPNRFAGKVYFLVNGGTGSAAAEFTAVAHSNKLGLFIGEETGGNYTGGNGGEFISFSLPKTNIQVGIPLLYYHNAVNKPLQEGRGTIPDHYVPDNIEDILKGNDTQLNFAFDLIKKESD